MHKYIYVHISIPKIESLYTAYWSAHTLNLFVIGTVPQKIAIHINIRRNFNEIFIKVFINIAKSRRRGNAEQR